MDDASRVQLQNAVKSLSVDRTDNGAWQIVSDQTRVMGIDAAKRVLRGKADFAEDVVQEAFSRLFQYCKFADLLDVDAFLGYLRTVCCNAARDMLKSVAESAGQGELEDIRVSNETPEDLVIAQDTLNEFMNQLNETDREVLGLSMDGYDLAEIADRLGLSYSNAGVRLYRSRERLRNYLKRRHKSVNPVCKKSDRKEVIHSQETGVKKEPDSLVSIRGTQGPTDPLIRGIHQSEPAPLVAQSFSHSR